MIREEFRLLNSEKLKTRRAVVYDLQTMTKHTRRMHHAHSQFERNGEKETSEREYAPTYIVSLRDVFFFIFFSNPEDEVVFPLFSPSAMNFSSLTSRVFAVFLFFFSSTSSSLSSSPSLDLDDDDDDVVIF